MSLVSCRQLREEQLSICFYILGIDAEVVFVSEDYRIGEESGSVSICVESGVSGGFETALTVGLAAQNGTASELLTTHTFGRITMLLGSSSIQ